MEKKSPPNLSIIVATFNVGGLLKSALDSITKQDYKDWECVIIDGGSKDCTLDIIKGYAAKDSRFRYISEPDDGIYDAFNKGWKKAKGEWVYYLGADDELTKDGFKKIFSTQVNEYDIVYGNVIYKVTATKLNYRKTNSLPSLVKRNLQCSHQGFVMKRSAIKKNSGFNNKDYMICADYDLILRAYLNASKMIYIDANLAIFNVCGTSCSTVMYKECFLIRKRNKSIGVLNNVSLYIKGIVIFLLRKIKYAFNKY